MKFILGIAVGFFVTAISFGTGMAVGAAIMNGMQDTTEEK